MKKLIKLVLLGLPGSGKSTFGKYISNVLNLPYYDLDQLIEQRSEMKIPDIFSQQGEGKFRTLETETLSWVLQQDEAFVLASGGGCPCFNDNMELINKKGISVYLDVPLLEISHRLGGTKIQNRPMFQGLNPAEIQNKLKSLLIQRSYFYDQAQIKLSGIDFSTELFVSELISLLKN